MNLSISSSLHWLVSQFDENQNVKFNDTIQTELNHNPQITNYEFAYEESDFVLPSDETSESISDRVLLQRSKNNYQFLQTSSPLKSKLSAQKTKSQRQIDKQDELAKVDGFVDLPRMICSLSNIEQLIKSPEFEYNDFKRNYIKSSLDLLDCIKDKNELDDYIPQSTSSGIPKLRTYSALKDVDKFNDDQKTRIILQIVTLSYKVLKIVVELITPIIFQIIVWLKYGMHNEMVERIFYVLGNIILITLNILLENLQSYQRKKQHVQL